MSWKRRLVSAALQLVALSLIAFALTAIIPGDVLSDTRLDPRTSSASIEAWRQQLHLSEPWWKRYASWSGRVIRCDFGSSLASGIPVAKLLGPRLMRTLEIVLPAWGMSWLLGLVLAVAGVRWGGWKWLERAAAILQLLPEAILASLLTWALIVRFGVDPESIVLPLMPVTLALAPAVFLHSAAALDGALQSRFVKLAQVARVNPVTLWTRYLAPAAANPLLNLVGPSFAAAFGSALVVEAITGWPGMGSLFADAFRSRDYPVTQAVLLLLGAALIVLNLFSDLALFRLDPRIRTGEDE
ncbi:MAG: ABC transporter permease [Bryobacteraceae bacterium]